MDITVTFRHMKPSQSLKDYAEEKISKINKFFDFPIEAHIVLAVEKFRHMADITLSLNGTMIKGVEETEDMYSSIDQVMDKIEIQAKKYQSKIRNRRADSRKPEEEPSLDEMEEVVESGLDEPSIEVEKLVAKPMDPEEASMQLNMSQHEFLVFRNSRSNEINVLYKRNDGNHGLIEPSN